MVPFNFGFILQENHRLTIKQAVKDNPALPIVFDLGTTTSNANNQALKSNPTILKDFRVSSDDNVMTSFVILYNLLLKPHFIPIPTI